MVTNDEPCDQPPMVTRSGTVDQMKAAAPTASSPMPRRGSTTVMGSLTTA